MAVDPRFLPDGIEPSDRELVMGTETNWRGATPTLYVLGRNAAGRWVLRDTSGLSEAIFQDRHQAIHYALFQAERPGAVLSTDEPVEMAALQ